MSEIKHTRGPWTMETMRPNTLGPAWINSKDRRLIADCGQIVSLTNHGFCGRVEVEEIEANARLIAAAPDLFSIVKRFIALPSAAWHPERHAADEAELMNDARAAIAKAEGST